MAAHSISKQPCEAAPVLRQFGKQASRAAMLVRLRPELAHRIMLAPRRAMHVYVALMQQHAADEVPLERTADLLLGEHPRTLLRAVVPGLHERLYRLLDRAALPAWPLEAYRLLNTVLSSPISDLLDGVSDLTPTEVERLGALLTADPVIQRASKLTRESYYRDNLSSVVAVLRSYDALHDLGALPAGAGARAIAKRAKADLSRIRMPDTSLPKVKGWTRLLTVGDLWRYASRMELCIAPGSYSAGDATISALMGRSVFLYSTEHDALAQLRAVPVDAWVIAEAAVAKNGRLPPGVVASLHDGLVAAGAVLLPATPQAAIDKILRVLREKWGDDGDLLEEMGNEDDVEDDDGAGDDQAVAA